MWRKADCHFVLPIDERFTSEIVFTSVLIIVRVRPIRTHCIRPSSIKPIVTVLSVKSGSREVGTSQVGIAQIGPQHIRIIQVGTS